VQQIKPIGSSNYRKKKGDILLEDFWCNIS
jgi:hypothetical protein